MSLLVQEPVHAHEWRLVEVQWDEYGAAIREWACPCGSVRYS